MAAIAREKPDFSGDWTLNRQASTLSPAAAAFQSGVMRIDHREPISFRYELQEGGRRLRAAEQLRGGGRDQDNVWVYERS